MTQIIPLAALPSQTLRVVLSGQLCQITVYQKFTGLFVDLYVNAVPVIVGVLAENCNRIVRYAYFGFSGDLMFLDTQGTYYTPPVNFAPGYGGIDPYYTGLGTQFQLIYLTAAELAQAGFDTVPSSDNAVVLSPVALPVSAQLAGSANLHSVTS